MRQHVLGVEVVEPEGEVQGTAAADEAPPRSEGNGQADLDRSGLAREHERDTARQPARVVPASQQVLDGGEPVVDATLHCEDFGFKEPCRPEEASAWRELASHNNRKDKITEEPSVSADNLDPCVVSYPPHKQHIRN